MFSPSIPLSILFSQDFVVFRPIKPSHEVWNYDCGFSALVGFGFLELLGSAGLDSFDNVPDLFKIIFVLLEVLVLIGLT